MIQAVPQPEEMRVAVCQIGAREHYAVARGLAALGRLAALVTDAWVPDRPLLKACAPRLSGRFHPALDDQRVEAFTASALLRDGIDRALHLTATSTNMRRNEWFQRKAVSALQRLGAQDRPGAVFAYSYAAREIFHEAKRRGWLTILGQIDPGPAEARIVIELAERHSLHDAASTKKPETYWQSWRDELTLADRIVVNSQWSRSALMSEGVPEEKLIILPLAYDGLRKPRLTQNAYADERQMLRVLFLGQAILRKGIVELIEAAAILEEDAIRIDVVGPATPEIARRLRDTPNIVWHGAVPRTEVDRFYRRCDVFLLPTHSDGFALTQLEAIANDVPIIVSKRCGEVVRDGINGIVLPEVSALAISHALTMLARDRKMLARLTEGARDTVTQGPIEIAAQLIGVIEASRAPLVDVS